MRAATYLRVPEAIEALAVADELPSDRFMDYVKTEAARVLRPEYDKARQTGWRPAFATAAGLRFLYASLTNDELAKEPRSPELYRAILTRSGLDERLRAEAVEAIAKDEGKTVVHVVMDAIARLDARSGGIDAGVVLDLMRVASGRPAAERAAAPRRPRAARDAGPAAARAASATWPSWAAATSIGPGPSRPSSPGGWWNSLRPCPWSPTPR